MVDRTTVLPPLVHAVLDVSDRVPWGPAAPVSGGLMQQTAVAPFCANGAIVRYTATLPDVQASVLALLFTREVAHVDIVDTLGHPREVARSSVLFECDLSPLEPDSECARWLSLNSTQERKMEEALFVGGGENPEGHECPAGFPDCHPSSCPIGPQESLTYFASETPNHRTRDFVIRKSPVVDLSIPSIIPSDSAAPELCSTINVVSVALPAADSDSDEAVESPRSPGPRTRITGKVNTTGISDLHLAREAAGIPPHHSEAYVHGTCSCSGAVPAVKCAVRSGFFCRIITSSTARETIGCTVDVSYAFHIAITPEAATMYMHSHLLRYIAQAKFLTKDVFGGASVDIRDPAVAERALTALRKKRHRELRAAAAEATGCCCCCAVQ